MRHPAVRGAILGLVVGVLALAFVFVAAWQCLPYRIAPPPGPWPWACAGPAYTAIGYLAFPANVLTNDLSRAVKLAPLALIMYAILGALIGLVVREIRAPTAAR